MTSEIEVEQLRMEVQVLRAELAEAKRDAERYRWLRDCGEPYSILVVTRAGTPLYDSDLDVAVDAAIAKEQDND